MFIKNIYNSHFYCCILLQWERYIKVLLKDDCVYLVCMEFVPGVILYHTESNQQRNMEILEPIRLWLISLKMMEEVSHINSEKRIWVKNKNIPHYHSYRPESYWFVNILWKLGNFKQANQGRVHLSQVEMSKSYYRTNLRWVWIQSELICKYGVNHLIITLPIVSAPSNNCRNISKYCCQALLLNPLWWKL